jgi:hypothetical protein
VLQEHEHRLAVDKRSISLIKDTIIKVGMTLANLKDRVSKDKMIMRASFSLSTDFDESIRIIRGLNSLAQHRISPDLVLRQHMTAALIQLQKNMDEEGDTLGAARYDNLY